MVQTEPPIIRWRPAVSDAPEKPRQRDLKCLGEFFDIDQRNVALSSFYSANVGPVQSAEALRR